MLRRQAEGSPMAPMPMIPSVLPCSCMPKGYPMPRSLNVCCKQQQKHERPQCSLCGRHLANPFGSLRLPFTLSLRWCHDSVACVQMLGGENAGPFKLADRSKSGGTSCSWTLRASMSIIIKAPSATEAALYPGAVQTGTPLAFAASISMLL